MLNKGSDLKKKKKKKKKKNQCTDLGKSMSFFIRLFSILFNVWAPSDVQWILSIWKIDRL